ncbi:MAG: hypothetical protein Q4C49_13925 [Bacillota bacterium]|nr:hypothetical protein [Bacillota bacterium]
MKTNDIVMRDPFVLPYEGKYYLFGTRSFTCWENHATGVDVYLKTAEYSSFYKLEMNA